MKYEYTFTVGEFEDTVYGDGLKRFYQNTHIAMSGAVDIMNELLISEHVKFILGDDNNICLVDVESNAVLKDIPQAEIMHLASELGVLQSLAVH